jgi:hypothetical protein
MLGQVGEQDGQVEADSLGRFVVGLLEGGIVDLTLVVLFAAAQQELDFLPTKETDISLSKCTSLLINK